MFLTARNPILQANPCILHAQTQFSPAALRVAEEKLDFIFYLGLTYDPDPDDPKDPFGEPTNIGTGDTSNFLDVIGVTNALQSTNGRGTILIIIELSTPPSPVVL